MPVWCRRYCCRCAAMTNACCEEGCKIGAQVMGTTGNNFLSMGFCASRHKSQARILAWPAHLLGISALWQVCFLLSGFDSWVTPAKPTQGIIFCRDLEGRICKHQVLLPIHQKGSKGLSGLKRMNLTAVHPVCDGGHYSGDSRWTDGSGQGGGTGKEPLSLCGTAGSMKCSGGLEISGCKDARAH